jgi:hypothetical protein
VLALIALICFAIAFVLKLVGSAVGSLDVEAFVILGLAFVAGHMAHPIAIRRGV